MKRPDRYDKFIPFHLRFYMSLRHPNNAQENNRKKLTEKLQALHSGDTLSLVTYNLFNNHLLLLLKKAKSLPITPNDMKL